MRNIFLSDDFQISAIVNMFFLALSSFLKLYNSNFSQFRVVRNFKFVFLYNYFIKKKRFLKLKDSFRKQLLASLESEIFFKLRLNFVMFPFDVSNVFAFIDFSVKKSDFFHSLNFFIIFFRNFKSFFSQNFFLSIFFLFNKFHQLNKRFHKFNYKNLFNFFFFLRWQMILKMQHHTRILRISLQYFSFTRYFLYYFGDLFFFSLRINSRLKYLLNFLAKKLFFSKTDNNMSIVLKKLEVSEITAAIVSKYLAVRLRQRFQLREALFPVMRYLSNSRSFIRGFRITCAGRFTRKEIALYDVRTYSSVPFGGAASFLDFSLSEVILKYSICGIKVWLHKKLQSENSFAIYGIGLNFILPPISSNNFANFFYAFLTNRIAPYNPMGYNDVLFKFLKLKFKKRISLKSPLKKKSYNSRQLRRKIRNAFALYAFKFLSSLDFFYYQKKFLHNRKTFLSKKKIVAKKKKTNNAFAFS